MSVLMQFHPVSVCSGCVFCSYSAVVLGKWCCCGSERRPDYPGSQAVGSFYFPGKAAMGQAPMRYSRHAAPRKTPDRASVKRAGLRPSPLLLIDADMTGRNYGSHLTREADYHRVSCPEVREGSHTTGSCERLY